MDGLSFGSRPVWDARVAPAAAGPTPVYRALPDAATARAYYQSETLRGRPDRHEPAERFSLAWFEHVERQRLDRAAPWLAKLLEFHKHAGESLLALGEGLGTDWVQYARRGTSVVVCCPSAEQLALVRRNFELRGLGGQFLFAPPTHLPLPDASLDLACLHHVLGTAADPTAVIAEVYRVLKPGGKVLALAPARYDVDYWTNLFLPWHRRPAAGRSFGARELVRLFESFTVQRVHKRHLRRSELPHVWRWLPLSVTERWMGRVLVLKAFKPVRSALPARAAA